MAAAGAVTVAAAPPPPAAAQTAALCAAVAARGIAWTQGAGGNVSVEDRAAGRLWIKASGRRLDAVGDDPQALAVVDVASLGPALAELGGAGAAAADDAAYSAALARARDPAHGRPSMETGMHLALRGRAVLHFHSLAAVAMAHHQAADPVRWHRWWVARGALVPQVLTARVPGWPLAVALSQMSTARGVVLLANHGIVLWDEDGACLDNWVAHERAFCAAWGLAGIGRLLARPAARDDLAVLRAACALAAPMRAALPDLVLFLPQLADYLEPAVPPPTAPAGEPWLRLRPEALERARDAAEVWLGWALLHADCPDVPALPAAMVTALPQMPSERFRQRLSAAAQATGADA